ITTVETKEASPAHFLIKIESFSLLGKCGIEKYDTNEFFAGEYKWKLIICPNEDENGKKHSEYISVNLAMVDTISLPANWEVNAVFNIFIFNQISGNYNILLDPSNGYLVNDNCVFGAEVFVVEREAVTECLSLKNVKFPYKRDWKISRFSKLQGIWNSEEFRRFFFTRKEMAKGTGRNVSIFLSLVDSSNSTPPGRVKARYIICLKNQFPDEHIQRNGTRWFSAINPAWGLASFIKLATINNPYKGFIVNDCCLLNIEISVEAVVQGSPLSI
ncbi:hypothetical protein MIMGU_mgv1a023974mg, partial [Erythranthe guttata]